MYHKPPQLCQFLVFLCVLCGGSLQAPILIRNDKKTSSTVIHYRCFMNLSMYVYIYIYIYIYIQCGPKKYTHLRTSAPAKSACAIC